MFKLLVLLVALHLGASNSALASENFDLSRYLNQLNFYQNSALQRCLDYATMKCDLKHQIVGKKATCRQLIRDFECTKEAFKGNATCSSYSWLVETLATTIYVVTRPVPDCQV